MSNITKEFKERLAAEADKFAETLRKSTTAAALQAVRETIDPPKPVKKAKTKKPQALKPQAAVAAPAEAVKTEFDHSPKTPEEAPKKRGRAKTQPAICSVGGCGRGTLAKGLCVNHYRAARNAAKKVASNAAAQPTPAS